MLVIIDVEATCVEPKDPNFKNEIIEIGAVKFNLKTLEIVDEFQCFIKPIINPILSDFCKELTTIKQSDVNPAHSFETEYNRFVKWYGSEKGNLFCSWGYYDKMSFERDCKLHNLEYKLGNNHWNIKRFYEEITGVAGKSGVGLHKAVKQCGLEFEGVQHRAKVDAINIARVLKSIMSKENN